MKKAIIITLIILVSVCVGLCWTIGEDYVTKKFHPFKYEEYVEKYSEEYGVPREIIYAVIKCESSFTADAESPKGALGLMQIMPETYEWLCGKLGEEPNRSLLYDPEVNIKYGTYYLSYLHSRFGVWETVYAAYNAGEGTVRAWLEDGKYGDKGRLKEIPYGETKEYAEKVAQAAETYAELILEKEHGDREYVPVEK